MDIRFLDLSSEYVVVTDRDNCLLFDRNGKFISKISSQGRGPGENIFFTQIKILNDKIFLPNVTLHEINIFNTKGKFLNTLKSPGRFSASKTPAQNILKRKMELEQLAASLDENDNPVLMLVKLKE
jgi:hypothetical protein